MKKFYILCLLLLTVAACKSPEKLIQEGNYDAAIDRSIKLVLKNKANEDDKAQLEKAYLLANQRDQDRARLLIAENKPENWDEIYKIYLALSNRQDEIQKVLPLEVNGKPFQYKYIDYTSSIVETKKRAAAYFYSEGKILMQQRNRESYREAYYNFLKVKDYWGNEYNDIQLMIDSAKDMGTSRVLVEVINQSGRTLPTDCFDNILYFSTSGLNSSWVEYNLVQTMAENEYDYFISVVIEYIDVSPENSSSWESQRRKTIQDGYKNELDRRGNIKRDSLGHEISVPNYKEITCTVIAWKQSKSAVISGEIEFVEANPQYLLQKFPIAGESYFEHITARIRGNPDALDPKDQELIHTLPAPYPNDFSMLYDCSQKLQKAVYDALNNNKGLIR